MGLNAFGVGCFHFALKSKMENNEYIKEIENSLEKIPNINNVNITTSKVFMQQNRRKEQVDFPNIQKGGEVRPYPLFSTIEFQIFIPDRIQQEMKKNRPVRTGTENFNVMIYYNTEFPFALIECVNASDGCYPADAVFVVREFLVKTFDSDYIQFQCMGPSPFHAHFFLKENEISDDDSENLTVSITDVSLGYDTITFYFNPKLSIPQAKQAMLRTIEGELSLYYKTVNLRSRQQFDWIKIQKSMDNIIAIQQLTGIKGYFRKLLSSSKMLNSSFIMLANFERDNIFIVDQIHTSYEKINSKKIFLKKYMDEETRSLSKFSIQQITNLINRFENRSLKGIELFTIFCSAVFGGIFGAIITSLLSKK